MHHERPKSKRFDSAEQVNGLKRQRTEAFGWFAKSSQSTRWPLRVEAKNQIGSSS
jgi:hypothetical protein